MAGADGERGAIPKQAREQPREQQLFFDNVNPATRLLEKRRQMYEVQDALENQKARFAKEEDQFRKKEEQLRVKDLQLQNQLVKFNKFLQDNEAKRQRSEKRAAEEAAQIKQKDEEILDLEKQLEDSRALCDKLEDEKNRNMKYE
ncbi:FAP73, partial [Symbiodinium sp. CCMP2456]